MENRNSFIEVYRILAVFSVLIIHYNGWFLGGLPDSFDFDNPTAHRIGQVIIASLCACCINCFLLISGYFGINLRWQSIVKFLIQLMGVYIPWYFIDCIVNGCPIQLKCLINNCLVISRGGYFVQCYFMLMLLSPVLNAFVERFQKKAIWVVLLLLVSEFYFDCIIGNERMGFAHGYSVAHFCLVYLIGRTIFIYRDKIIGVKRYKWVLLYLTFACLIAWMYIAGIGFTFDYSNPLVITTGVFSFLPFIYKSGSNRIINWVASGTFAVYLIQVCEPAFSFLCKMDKMLLEGNTYLLYLIKSIPLLIAFFMVCVLYDKLRAFCSTPLLRLTNRIGQSIIQYMTYLYRGKI